MNSRLSVVSSQEELPLLRQPLRTGNPPIEVISSYRNRTDAITQAIKWAGYTEGEIADAMSITTSQMSKILSPTTAAHFPTDRYHALNRLLQNTIVTAYDALQEGFVLQKLESKLEEENRELREKVEQLEHEQEVVKNFLKETSV